MYLCYTGTRARSPLHNTLSGLTREGDAKNLLSRAAKVLADDLVDIFPVVLRGVIEHAREHFLKFRGQDGGLHSDGLADFQVQTAIVTQEVGQTLSIAGVYGIDVSGQRRVGTEVYLVIQGYQEAQAEGSSCACERRGVELSVEDVDGPSG